MAIVSGVTGATNWSTVDFDEAAVSSNLDDFTSTFSNVLNASGSVTTFNDSTIKVNLSGFGTLTIKGFGFTGTTPTIKSIVWDNGDDGMVIKGTIKINLNSFSVSGKITSFSVEIDGFSVSASGSLTLQSDGDVVGVFTRLAWAGSGSAYSLSGSFSFDDFGAVSGTVTGFSVKLADGSSLVISGVAIPMADLDTVLTVGDLLAMLPAELTGDDVISFANGTALIDGGLGNDTYVITSASQTLAEQASQGTDSIQIKYNVAVNTDLDLATFANTENLRVFGTGLFDIAGTAADNILVGNLQANSIEGGDGNDVLLGLTGNDTLDGGAGVDTMTGGLGNDTYVVDEAGDVVAEKLDEGTDTVESSVTRTLGANQERLTLTGTDAVDGTGNTLGNVITGNAGVNVLTGLGGSDFYIVQTVGDAVVEAAVVGIDTVQSSVSFTLGANVERLILGDDGLAGTGNTMANRITGGAGNDTLDGGAGNDTLLGGAGDDVYVVDRSGDVVGEALDMGEDSVQSSVTWVLGANVENLALTGSANINGIGNGLDNEISGNDGNNILNGGAGADTLGGGLGNDTYFINSAAQTTEEEAAEGTDLLRITYAVGALTTEIDLADFANIENLLVTGTGLFNLTGTAEANGLTGNASSNRLDGGAGVDTMAGSKGNDTYVVDEAGDVVVEKLDEGTDTVESSVTRTLGANQEHLTLTGAAAIDGTGNGLANKITGNDGINVLTGLAGNDTYVVQTVGDSVVEAAAGGTDTVISSIDFTLGLNVERLMLGDGGLAGTGNTMANRITGGAGNDTLDGGAGNDTLLGGAGDDVYVVDRSGDVVGEALDMGEDSVQSSVTWVLGANVENLALTGTANINGIGNGLGNELTGNTGNNALNGGAGNDTMTGGAGNDAFYFSTAFGAANVDTITDFTSGQDVLRFDNDVFTKLGPVGLMQAFRFASGPGESLADAPGEWLIYDTTTGDLFYDVNGTLAGGSVKIATLSGAPALAATDIFVVE